MLRDELAAWLWRDATTCRNSMAPTREKEGICARWEGEVIGEGVGE